MYRFVYRKIKQRLVALFKFPSYLFIFDIMHCQLLFRYGCTLYTWLGLTILVSALVTSSSLPTHEALTQPSRREPIDAFHSLLLLNWKPARSIPSNNYYAAIISAQAENFAAYRASGTPFVQDKYLHFNDYGVEISFDKINLDRELTFVLIGDTLKVLANFMLRMKICDVEFTISRTSRSYWNSFCPLDHCVTLRSRIMHCIQCFPKNGCTDCGLPFR